MIREVVRWIRRRAIACARRRFAECAEDLVFDPFSSRIRGYEMIYIGERVFIGHGADFSIHKQLVIGDDVLIGPQVMILSGSHPVDNIGAPVNAFHEGNNGRCVISSDVWIGARVIIVGDVNIGEGAVVGAGAIVTRSLPPYTISAGIPCRPIRKRFADSDLRRHLDALGRSKEADSLIMVRDHGIKSFNKMEQDD